MIIASNVQQLNNNPSPKTGSSPQSVLQSIRRDCDKWEQIKALPRDIQAPDFNHPEYGKPNLCTVVHDEFGMTSHFDCRFVRDGEEIIISAVRGFLNNPPPRWFWLEPYTKNSLTKMTKFNLSLPTKDNSISSEFTDKIDKNPLVADLKGLSQQSSVSLTKMTKVSFATQHTAEFIREVALEYAQKFRWAVFSVHGIRDDGNCTCGNLDCEHPGKHPRTKHGVKDATTDAHTIRNVFDWSNANIGIATGKISDFIVVDLDVNSIKCIDGKDSMHKLEKENGELPDTPTVLTGGGGEHKYFKYPTSHNIGNKVGIRDGIDIRGDGGYVVVPPSRHKSMRTYDWDTISDPNDIPMADMPKWLINIIIVESTPITSTTENTGGQIKDGSRNQTLFQIAASYRGIGMGADDIAILLHSKNKVRCKPPLSDTEVQAIIKSVVGRYPAGKQQENEQKNAWSAPEPLPPLELEAGNFPDALIPEPWRNWILDMSDLMQLPPEMMTVCCFTIASNIIGTRLLIQPKQYDDSWQVSPNLWGGIVAPSSAMKSPIMKAALKPLYMLEDKSEKEYKAEMLEHRKKSANPKYLEPEPIRRRRIINDATPEKIGVLLKENPNGLLLFRDELLALLLMLEKAGYEGYRQLLLEAFDGIGRFVTDRILRGTIDIPNLCLSIMGGIQPDKFASYFAKILKSGSSDDGFLARFQLLVYPKISSEWKRVDRVPNAKAQSRAYDVFAKLDEADFQMKGFAHVNNRTIARFDDGSQELFLNWLDEREILLRSKKIQTPLFEAYLAKQKKTMPALALINHAVELYAGKTESLKVSLQAAQNAIDLCKFFAAHSEKIYGHAIRADIVTAHKIKEQIENGIITDGMTVRAIIRMHGADQQAGEIVASALELLEGHHYLKVIAESPLGKGRPREIICLNPTWVKK